MPTATVTLVPPLSGSGGGRIVFASKRDDNYEIYVMNADGTDQRRLTNNPHEDGRPAWSPDCRQIAFGSDHSGRFDIYVMGTDGSGVRRLTNKGDDNGYPAWSPAPPGGTGGVQIAFSRYDPDSDLYVMNADGTNQQRLTQTGVGGVDMDIFDPAWSPDGTQIVCVVDSNPDPTVEESAVYVLNVRDILQGTGSAYLRPLPRAGNLNDNPTWSPKGSQIAFSAEVDGRWGIYVVNADGANLRRPTQTKDYDEYAPAWSPDGTQIVYQSNPDGNWDIYIMNADGTGRRRLTTDAANDVDPDWCR
jgi:Tol biopolymer transport system component